MVSMFTKSLSIAEFLSKLIFLGFIRTVGINTDNSELVSLIFGFIVSYDDL